MKENEKKLEKLYEEYRTINENLNRDILDTEDKLKKVDDNQEDLFNSRNHLISFWDNIMDMQSEGGYGDELRKLEETRNELIQNFKKAEISFQNEYEDLSEKKNKLFKKQEEYEIEYNRKLRELKEKKE